MNNLLTELKKYFESHSKEQIQKDWATTEEFDNVGIMASEFLTSTKYSPHCQNLEIQSTNNANNKFSPEFSSGLFLTKIIPTYA